MADTQENNQETPDATKPSAAPQTESEQAIVSDSKESKASPSQSKAVMYGTRKSRPGAQNASSVKPISEIRGAFEEDEVIEMDDLPMRATAPEHLIANSESPERPEPYERPARGDRRRDNDRKPRERRRERKEEPETPTKVADSDNTEIEAKNETETAPNKEDENRLPRFDAVSEEKLRARHNVQEFRPTKDGQRAKKKPAPEPSALKDSEDSSTAFKPELKSKNRGFFAWFKSLFTGEPEPEKKPKYPNRRGRGNGRNGNRSRNRRNGESENREDGQPRKRRNRRPRRQGEGNGQPRAEHDRKPRAEGDSDGNRKPRRRRPRRPRQDGQKREQVSSD